MRLNFVLTSESSYRVALSNLAASKRKLLVKEMEMDVIVKFIKILVTSQIGALI